MKKEKAYDRLYKDHEYNKKKKEEVRFLFTSMQIYFIYEKGERS